MLVVVDADVLADVDVDAEVLVDVSDSLVVEVEVPVDADVSPEASFSVDVTTSLDVDADVSPGADEETPEALFSSFVSEDTDATGMGVTRVVLSIGSEGSAVDNVGTPIMSAATIIPAPIPLIYALRFMISFTFLF